MWSKLSNVLKPSRQFNDSDSDRSSAHSAPADVLSQVYEQHPNMSVFHERTNDNDLPFPTPSPPPSPSKQRRKLTRRLSSKFNLSGDSQPSSLKFPIGLPKKVRSHLHLKSNCTFVPYMHEPCHSSPSQPTLQPHSSPSLATLRTLVQAQIHIGSTKTHLARPSKYFPSPPGLMANTAA